MEQLRNPLEIPLKILLTLKDFHFDGAPCQNFVYTRAKNFCAAKVCRERRRMELEMELEMMMLLLPGN